MRPSVLIVASLLSLSACASESTGPESAPVATTPSSSVTTDFITIEGSDHGFYDDDAVRANAAMVDWFEQHLN